jgi:ATP-dependent helicase YprA (DUF1998 family)
MEAVCNTFPGVVYYHLKFASRFFKSLKLVAVDELHYYTGLFGRLVSRTVPRRPPDRLSLQPRCTGDAQVATDMRSGWE